MAKQTFTTGQVLTAAQMTNLQQTAMGGGSPVQKTASYVLVAADAGTVIQMNSASSTTITVNTALFAAGDSVQIQNIGAGVCTVTAGTATVTTAGSLALSQWEGGMLYFTSTSAAIFFDIVQSGSTSPLTTKGDLYTRTSSADARLPVGTNGYTLVADSTQSTGLAWAAPAGGGKVLQVVSTTKTDTFTTTSSSLVDVTGYSVTITPSATSSKILILYDININSNPSTHQGWGVLLRNSTQIKIGDASSTRPQVTIAKEMVNFYNDLSGQSGSFLDSPSTTSALTYKIQVYRYGGSSTDIVAVNRTVQDNTDRPRGASTITVMEIGA